MGNKSFMEKHLREVRLRVWLVKCTLHCVEFEVANRYCRSTWAGCSECFKENARECLKLATAAAALLPRSENQLRVTRTSIIARNKSSAGRATSRRIIARHVARYGKAGIDAGSAEYFNALNKDGGFHIQHPNVYFSKLGYFADGYDPVLHAWFEYDSPYHAKVAHIQRDLIRQKNIVEHFESVGHPLNHFYRINATGKGKLEMKDVL